MMVLINMLIGSFSGAVFAVGCAAALTALILRRPCYGSESGTFRR